MKSAYVKDRGFYKDFTIETNKYTQTDHQTGSNEIFSMFYKIKSESESDIENLLQDSDTKYIAKELIPDDKEESHEFLTPERAAHLEGEILV